MRGVRAELFRTTTQNTQWAAIDATPPLTIKTCGKRQEARYTREPRRIWHLASLLLCYPVLLSAYVVGGQVSTGKNVSATQKYTSFICFNYSALITVFFVDCKMWPLVPSVSRLSGSVTARESCAKSGSASAAMSGTKIVPAASDTADDAASSEQPGAQPPKALVEKSLSMIERGEVDVDEDDLRKLVPVLLEDASTGNLEAVTQILNLDDKTPNFSIDQQLDDEGRSALHRAALEGRFDILKILLERNPDTIIKGRKFIDLPDRYGNTALFLVCIRLDRSDYSQAKYLLDLGADINIIKESDKMSVLHWACHHGNPELVQMLLEHLKGDFTEAKQTQRHKLPFLADKDQRLPIDIAGLQYIKKWDEEDDDLRGDSLLEDPRLRSSVDEFAQVVKTLAMPAWIADLQPSKAWNRLSSGVQRLAIKLESTFRLKMERILDGCIHLYQNEARFTWQPSLETLQT